MRGTRSGPAPSAGRAPAGTDGQADAVPAGRAAGWLVAAVPALAELIIGGYRISGPSLWRDEAATISGSRRPLGAIIAMMANQDAVHGPYYLLMHPVIAAGGISATVLRLPSLIAMCLAAGLTAALGRRLALASGLPAPGLTGLAAGLALAAVPLATRYAQEARPYALATLFAVLATYALVRAATDGGPGLRRGWWWVLYGAALLIAGLFDLFAMLIAVAHGLSLAWAASGRAGSTAADGRPGGEAGAMARRWLAACAAAALLIAPLVYLSAGQYSQLSWVRRPGLSTLAALVRDFAGSAAVIPVVAVLAVLGCLAGAGLRRGGGVTLAAVTLPWLVLPPVILLAVSLARPVYVERYIVFCLPALAIATGAGLIWLAVLARRALAGRGLAPRRADLLSVAVPAVLALVLIAALIGPQRAVRQAGARADNLRALAAVVAARERPGDAILYLPQDAALAGMAYPAPFRRLRDIGLGRSPVASGTLRGLQAPAGVIAARLRGAARVWTVQWAVPLSGATAAPPGLTRLLAPLRAVGRWRIQSVILRLYVRRAR